MNSSKAINVIFFLLLFTCSSACKNQRLQTDTLLISIEKTPCLGPCESYKLEIYSSRLVKFNGLSNHMMVGRYEARIEQKAFQDVIEQFQSSDFFNFKNQYTGNVTDLPTTYLYFKDKGNEKMIQDYYNAPPRLKELEKIIEGLVESLKWKKTD